MPRVTRVPVTAIAIFGVGALIASAVGVAVWLGFASARRNTEALLAERAQTLIGSMEATIEARFRPIVEQGRWVRQQVASGSLDLADTTALDAFMRGVFAGTPEVAGIAVVDPRAKSRRWRRSAMPAIEEDWSNRPPINDWLATGLTLNAPNSINALSEAMLSAMSDACDKIAGDRSVKAVILRSAGDHFWAGHNLKEMTARSAVDSSRFDRSASVFHRKTRRERLASIQRH